MTIGKISLNFYFVIFFLAFSIRNIAEFFITPKNNKKYQNKKEGLCSLIIFSVSYLISGIAVSIYLLFHEVNIFYFILFYVMLIRKEKGELL